MGQHLLAVLKLQQALEVHCFQENQLVQQALMVQKSLVIQMLLADQMNQQVPVVQSVQKDLEAQVARMHQVGQVDPEVLYPPVVLKVQEDLVTQKVLEHQVILKVLNHHLHPLDLGALAVQCFLEDLVALHFLMVQLAQVNQAAL